MVVTGSMLPLLALNVPVVLFVLLSLLRFFMENMFATVCHMIVCVVVILLRAVIVIVVGIVVNVLGGVCSFYYCSSCWHFPLLSSVVLENCLMYMLVATDDNPCCRHFSQ